MQECCPEVTENGASEALELQRVNIQWGESIIELETSI